MLTGDICVQGEPSASSKWPISRLTRQSLGASSRGRKGDLRLRHGVARTHRRAAGGELRRLRETVEQLHLERASPRKPTRRPRILDRIEDERKTTRRSITASIDKLVTPVVHAIESQAPAQMRPLITLLKQRLEEVASPFADNLSRAFASLTPLEISLCRMIRDNLTTKEIARIRHVSPSTVSHQREQIRRKLGIAGSDANLATYLRMFLTGDAHASVGSS